MALDDVVPDPEPFEEPQPATPTINSRKPSRMIITRFISG
jgi:hypothetical protein